MVYEETGTLSSRLFFIVLMFGLAPVLLPFHQVVAEFAMKSIYPVAGVGLIVFLLRQLLDCVLYFIRYGLHKGWPWTWTPGSEEE